MTGDKTSVFADDWSGEMGQRWLRNVDHFEAMLEPIGTALLDRAAIAPGERIVDLGCGGGATSRAIAARVGAQGAVLGLDISPDLIVAARARAGADFPALRFFCGDAASAILPAAPYDRLVSRFGVMFFDDPTAAFNTLRRAARPGAGLHVISWRDAAENPFMTVAERAAAPLLPAIPPRQPDAPGQFAFADRRRVHRLLDAAGWQAIDIQPVDLACTLPTHELERYFTRLGPLGRVLHEADPALRGRIVDVVRAAFQPYVDGETVRFTAACWSVVAQAPAM